MLDFDHPSGREGLPGQDWFSRFDPGYTMEVTESRDWGDRVLVVTTHHAKGRASAIPITQQTAQVMTLAGGRIVRQDFFPSRDQAVESVSGFEIGASDEKRNA